MSEFEFEVEVAVGVGVGTVHYHLNGSIFHQGRHDLPKKIPGGCYCAARTDRRHFQTNQLKSKLTTTSKGTNLLYFSFNCVCVCD